jgi:CheY-like chemotaxis protein
MNTGTVRLLIVDDNAAFIRLIRVAFEARSSPYKWELAEAFDGETALACVFGDEEDVTYSSPDLILPDWNLPKMVPAEFWL